MALKGWSSAVAEANNPALPKMRDWPMFRTPAGKRRKPAVVDGRAPPHISTDPITTRGRIYSHRRIDEFVRLAPLTGGYAVLRTFGWMLSSLKWYLAGRFRLMFCQQPFRPDCE